jgi:hypothetical protein
MLYREGMKLVFPCFEYMKISIFVHWVHENIKYAKKNI